MMHVCLCMVWFLIICVSIKCTAVHYESIRFMRRKRLAICVVNSLMQSYDRSRVLFIRKKEKKKERKQKLANCKYCLMS